MDPAEERAGTGARVPAGTDGWPGGRAPGAGRPSAGWPPDVGDLLGGRFLLRGLLGAGAAGVVFEALDQVSGQPVALKVLRPDAVRGNGLERLQREVRLSRPGHPNVVRLNDLHEADGLLLLSMELVEGQSLSAQLSGGRDFTVGEVVALGRQLAAALAYLHENGLVHRDVKPGNVLLAGNGTAKLCDLGLLRPVEHGLTVTMTEMVVGTPAYMAPEQGAGKELTGATDVYALGLTLWQALTGKVPLSGTTAIETLTRRQREQPPRLRPLRPDGPRWLERLLRRMLAPRPEDRPAAARVGRALGASRFRPFPTARRLTAALVALVALGGVAAGANAIRTRKTVRFESEGNVVRGVDARGRQTWSHGFESPVRQLLEVDLDGDERKELVVSAWGSPGTEERIDRLPYSEVTVFRGDGSVMTRVRPEELADVWHHPFPKRFQPRAAGLDVDHDGRNELLVLCPHWAFYPTELLVYWPETRTWDRVLDHWGRIYEVASVPGPAARLRFLARNNALGLAHVLGEIEVTPPAKRPPDRRRGAMLATIPGLACSDPAASWVSYTLFSPWTGVGRKPVFTKLQVNRDRGTMLRFETGEFVFDPSGNPRSGPNRGRDLRDLRLEFATQELTQQGYDLAESSESSVLLLMTTLRDRFGALLSEGPYRLAFDLVFARQLARSGAPARAAALLGETVRDVPGEEAPYQLANFQALAGDLDSAARLLRGLTRDPQELRGGFDVPQLLVRIAAEAKNEEDLLLAVEALSLRGLSPVDQPALAAALEARGDLIMDRVRESDAEVRSCPYAPDGDATAALARWRLGRTRPEDVKGMETFVAGVRDAEVDGRLALAAALLGSGRAPESAKLSEELGRGLDVEARTSFERRQQLLLSKALQAKALLVAGRGDEALSLASGLLVTSRPGLLWTNLAREVLEEAGTTAGPERGRGRAAPPAPARPPSVWDR